MGVVLPVITELVKLLLIAFLFTVQGSTGYTIFPAPLIFSLLPPLEKPVEINAPASLPQPNDLHPPSLPPPMFAPFPKEIGGPAPSYSPTPKTSSPDNIAPALLNFEGHMPPPPSSASIVSPPYNAAPPPITTVSPPNTAAPPPLIAERHDAPMPPNGSQTKDPTRWTPVSAPVASPSQNSSHDSPLVDPIAPGISPIATPRPPEFRAPIACPGNTSFPRAPEAWSNEPVAAPPRKLGRDHPPLHQNAPAKTPTVSPGSDVFHTSTPPPSFDWKRYISPVPGPPDETPSHSPPLSHSPSKAPSANEPIRHSNYEPVPSLFPPKSSPSSRNRSSASSPSIQFHKQNHSRASIRAPALPPSSNQLGPVVSPFLPTSRRTRYAPPSLSPDFASPQPHSLPKPETNMSPAPGPSPTVATGWTKMPVLSPKVSPSGSSPRSPKLPLAPPVHALPPPPPNEDCLGTVCVEPYTNTPPGSPCGCVLPMRVGLRLSVAVYTFFPLVSELAQEIASGVFMKQSQVCIMGANAASQQPEKTIVLIDLVPLGERFDNTTASLIYQRFWHKQVVIKAFFFGDYEVLYVRYPGLPASPPMAPDVNIIDDGPDSGNNNNARTIKPLGVDVHKIRQKHGLGAGMIAIIALSASAALFLCSAVVWVLLVRHRGCTSQPSTTAQPLPPVAKPSGTTGSMIGSGLSSVSLSFGSSIAPFTGSAKTFGTSEIESATNNFDPSRILGEGGFGRVYSGVLEDGIEVAVKVLKRDDHQGGREFLAEVEMLSRLHHRNLVKLIGICTEERARCLVYELIPNGSVESHLHGPDKESAPLNWDARIKVALGAARGLAYLHEDSSPGVIHRDFKSSNILLEHDFTPKVSDFGLARTAMDEENKHISTRVMGTFGYVAPEYAMTGHLLVKSDVYSYGVVLLELLTGRKPVDMSQPPGQENLVAWARPLLASRKGLEIITDPSLGPDVPFDSVAKVAAIASMCVQPEVSHRPFMGEVVQALKLVCNECDEAKEVSSRSSSQDFSVDMDAEPSAGTEYLPDSLQNQTLVPDYDSELDIERGLSLSDLFSTSAGYARQVSGSFRRYSSSGPLRTGRGKQLWQMRRLKGESASEHAAIFRVWPGSH